MTRLSQMTLVASILDAVSKQGLTHLKPRHVNAIIKAADIIVEECSRPEKLVDKPMSLADWLKSDDTGLSSLFMAYMMYDGPRADYHFPRDADDFSRCCKLVEFVIPARKTVTTSDWQRLSASGKEWGKLVDNWAELCSLYITENDIKLTDKIRELTS